MLVLSGSTEAFAKREAGGKGLNLYLMSREGFPVPAWVVLLPIVVALAGICLAYYMYVVRPELPGVLAERIRPVYLFVYNKWYFDELYNFLFVRPAFAIQRPMVGARSSRSPYLNACTSVRATSS